MVQEIPEKFLSEKITENILLAFPAEEGPDMVKDSVHSAGEVSLRRLRARTTTPRTKRVACWNPISLPAAVGRGPAGNKTLPAQRMEQHVQAPLGRGPRSAGLRATLKHETLLLGRPVLTIAGSPRKRGSWLTFPSFKCFASIYKHQKLTN